MAESVFIPQNSTRKDIYDALLPQIDGILQTETDLTANLANFVAILKEAFGFFWIGFYWVKNLKIDIDKF